MGSPYFAIAFLIAYMFSFNKAICSTAPVLLVNGLWICKEGEGQGLGYVITGALQGYRVLTLLPRQALISVPLNL